MHYKDQVIARLIWISLFWFCWRRPHYGIYESMLT